MKIAIIGSGFFGSTIALKLSENKKYAITIFEKHNRILQNASKKNQMRFHLGYHYPRSKKTVNEIKKSNKDFINFYGNSILGNTLNYYSISKKKTKTSLKKYTNFLIRNNLSFKKINNSNFFSSKIDGSFITSEKTLNYNKLYKIVNKRLKKKNIKIKKKTTFLKKDLLKLFDITIYEIQLSLKRNERVELRDVFSLEPRIQKARISRNPKTNEKINTPEKKAILFKISKEWTKKINE